MLVILQPYILSKTIVEINAYDNYLITAEMTFQ